MLHLHRWHSIQDKAFGYKTTKTSWMVAREKYWWNVFLQSKLDAQTSWRRSKNCIKVQNSSLKYLHRYHNENYQSSTTSILPPHEILHKINKHKNKNRKGHQSQKLRHNSFEGGLLLPPFLCNIEAEASEHRWTFDHMALVASLPESGDSMPAVICHDTLGFCVHCQLTVGIFSWVNVRLLKSIFVLRSLSLFDSDCASSLPWLNTTWWMHKISFV